MFHAQLLLKQKGSERANKKARETVSDLAGLGFLSEWKELFPNELLLAEESEHKQASTNQSERSRLRNRAGADRC